jgi:NADH-ubiquinone oxidoreductase chain 6
VFLSHPVSIGLFLIVHTLVVGLFTGLFIGNFWFSYILFLVILGGVLVLFIYITSLSSNQKFQLSWNRSAVVIILFMVLTVGLLIFILPRVPLFPEWSGGLLKSELVFLTSLIKLYNSSSSYITATLIVYLLFALLVCVRVARGYRGALRNFN